MYRIVLIGLATLVIAAFLLRAVGVLEYSSIPVLTLMLGLLVAVGQVTNFVLARLFGVVANLDSTHITALILFFVLAAPTNTVEWGGIALAMVAAVASKYLITWRSAHIFNPAAFGVFAVGLVGIGNGAWWIASASLFIPTVLVATLVLYKLRRFGLFFAFLIPALALIILRTSPEAPFSEALTSALTLYPLIFLGAIMLTEPHTLPNTKFDRVIYGAIVGIAFASTFDIGFLASSPHLALLIGNLFTFIVTSRAAVTLKLVEKTQLTPTTYAFSFKPDRPLNRKAGQYMSFTLPDVRYNFRGNRRIFSLTSSPDADLVDIGVKFPPKGSPFKARLLALRIGDSISASNVAGEFLLPESAVKPVVFIAGGIGITPFISMIKHMLSTDTLRPSHLYYFVSDRSEVAYPEVLKQATQSGIPTEIRLGRDATLSPSDIATHPEAEFYVSGPPGFVRAYAGLLRESGIKRIHVDYFTGY